MTEGKILRQGFHLLSSEKTQECKTPDLVRSPVMNYGISYFPFFRFYYILCLVSKENVTVTVKDE